MSLALWKYPLHFLGYGFGAGLIPVLPGTFGSLVGVILFWLIFPLGRIVYAGIVAALGVLGILICSVTAKDLGKTDPSVIVWDEIVGFQVAMYLLPRDWRWVTAGFVVFRAFDVWKPFPISAVEYSFGLGFGIMADDIVAGVYTLAVLQLFYRSLAGKAFRRE
jgi:phosphatidylglycerophosphatase A